MPPLDTLPVNREQLADEQRRLKRRLQRLARQRAANADPRLFNLPQYVGKLVGTVRCAP